MPKPAIAHAISAPYTPVAWAKLRGSEKTPAPTMDPTTMAASVISGSFSAPDVPVVSTESLGGSGGSGRPRKSRAAVLIVTPSPSCVALERAGHAVPAASALADLESVDLDDLDAGVAVFLIAVHVLRIGDHDSGLERDDVVSAVPLFALLLGLVAARGHDAQLFFLQTDRVGNGAE